MTTSPALPAAAHLATRAHMVWYLAELVREDNLDGPDLQSVAANVDFEDPDSWYPWPGEQVRAYLLVTTAYLAESAEDLVASAARALGWDW
jgi:hypothetical protein